MILILYFGHTGTTKKAAELLKEQIENSVCYDGKKKNKLDYTQYDHIIFGTNVRMGKLNKKFIKVYNKLKKRNLNCNFSGFVVAADANQRGAYMTAMQKILPEDAFVGFFGGEFNPTQAKGLSKAILLSCIENFQKQNLPLPKLNLEAIQYFSENFK